jgi:hypothetical protein
MSRRDKIRAKLIRAVNQSAELQVLIAHHARIRRATGLVFVREILDDVLLEFRRLVNQVIRHAEFVTDSARIGDGLRAAAFVLGAIHAILRPELERDADDIKTLLDQKRRRRRGIYSSAHAADDALTLLRIHRRTLYDMRAPCKMVCETPILPDNKIMSKTLLEIEEAIETLPLPERLRLYKDMPQLIGRSAEDLDWQRLGLENFFKDDAADDNVYDSI